MSNKSHLNIPRPPWVSLLVAKGKGPPAAQLAVPPGFVLRTLSGKKCKTKGGLLTEFAQVLEFPDYFGHNWDALEECLMDLEWLPAKGYVLCVTEAEHVLAGDDEEYETLLEVLSDAGEAWAGVRTGDRGSSGVPFHVVFATSAAEKSKRKHWHVPLMEPDRQAATRRRQGSSSS
jgi:RNAse (barnase) inhibitor barstar